MTRERERDMTKAEMQTNEIRSALAAHDTVTVPHLAHAHALLQIMDLNMYREVKNGWLGEIRSCSSLAVLPDSAWVLLNKIYQPFFTSLYCYSVRLDTLHPQAMSKPLIFKAI